MGVAEGSLASCARMALTSQEPRRRERRCSASGVGDELTLLVSVAISRVKNVRISMAVDIYRGV